MQTLSRYLLRRHLAPFGLAIAGLTSLMLIQQIAKQLPSLLRKGLRSSVIVEVFVLSVPFIVAVTLPMAVLVAVVHVFTRLGADSEIAAMKPGDVSVRRLIASVLGGAACVAALSLLWNDQVLPRSNHRLRVLQVDIERGKGSLPPNPTYKSDREMLISELRRAAKSAREDADRATVEGHQASEHAARERAATYEVEIQKKYAISAACLVFALVGAAVGLRFQHGGLGLVIGVSFAVFTVYYVGLVGGEELGNRLMVSPFFAMWTPNLLLGLVGVSFLWRIPTPVYAGLVERPDRDRGPLPRTIKIAAWTLASYGTAVFLFAILLEIVPNWGRPDLPGAVSRGFGMGLIAWGLLNRARWAWWAGVLFTGLLLAVSLLALGAVTVMRAEGEHVTLPVGLTLPLVLSGLACATVGALLLAPSSRAAFRDPSA